MSGVRDSYLAPIYVGLAHGGEQRSPKPRVQGSSPWSGAKKNADVAQLVERQISNLNVVGSRPIVRSKQCRYSSVGQSSALVKRRSAVRIRVPAPYADMVKLVDTLDLGSSASRRGGSSPSIRTKLESSSMVEQRFLVSYVEGSSPSSPANTVLSVCGAVW